MRAETGRAVLAATEHRTQPGVPPLSSLVGRVAAARGLSVVDDRMRPPGTAVLLASPPSEVRPVPLVTPAPGLVTPPPVDRQLRSAPAGAAVARTCALLGVHGGAGVSTLLRAGLTAAGAVDAQREWPPAGPVLLVARTSTSGLERARDAARQHAAGGTGPQVRLLGLVLVVDAPGRLPPRIAALADLVCGAFDRTWQLPWLQEWRLATAAEPLPVHPEVDRLITHLRSLTGGRTSTEGDPR